MTTQSLTQAQLVHVLDYCSETGVFKWCIKPSIRTNAGDVAGSVTARGYVNISISAKLYRAHRLAWLYVYGSWPDGVVDHINGNPSDNRIANLRVTEQKRNSENQRLHANNKSGFRGVHWHKKQQQWVAMVGHNWKRIHIGSFNDLAEAVAAVKLARDKLFTHHRTTYSA